MEKHTGVSTINYNSPSIIMPIYLYENLNIQENINYLIGVSDVGRLVQNLNHYIYLISKKVTDNNSSIISPINELSDRVMRGIFILEGKLEGSTFNILASQDFNMIINDVKDSIITIDNYDFSIILKFEKGNESLASFYFKLTRKNSNDQEALLTVPQSLSQLAKFQ